jgi:hypothetical protein
MNKTNKEIGVRKLLRYGTIPDDVLKASEFIREWMSTNDIPMLNGLILFKDNDLLLS